MIDAEGGVEPLSNAPPSSDESEPPAPRWALRAAIGLGIAVAIFIVIDGMFWFVLRATGILSSGSSLTGWNSTMYAVWIVVAAFAGAGYTFAPLRPPRAAWWAWRAAGGTALAAILYIVLDTQLWLYLDRLLPSSFPVSGWPGPVYLLWLVLAVLFGARFVVAGSQPFGAAWWSWRALGGTILGLATYFAAVWLPLYAVSTAQSNGVPLPSLPAALAIVGSMFAVLAGAAYAAHPTRFYGPIEIGAGALEIFYLVGLVGLAPYALEFHSVAISIGTLAILLGLVVVILISMAGDVVTTIEDFSRPGERRAWQYPTPPTPESPRA